MVLPVFILLVLGTVDVGRVIWATTSLNSAAREGARFAIVHGGSASNPCPIGPPGPDSSSIQKAPCLDGLTSMERKQYIYDTTAAAVIAGGTNVAVTACYGSGCTGNTDTGDNSRGMPVTVTVTSQINLVTPALLGMTSFTVSGTTTMVVNH
jgi:Flp pilus assembly protein TadG